MWEHRWAESDLHPDGLCKELSKTWESDANVAVNNKLAFQYWQTGEFWRMSYLVNFWVLRTKLVHWQLNN